MNLDNLQVLLSFLGSILGLLFTSIIFLKKFIKNKKLKNILEKAEQITKEIIPCIIEAEQFVNYTGDEKKNYVMTKINRFAIENDIDFNFDYVSEKIEELILLSKQVNNNSKNQNHELDINSKLQKIITGLKV